MGKLKTKKAITKRVKVSKKGKVLRSKAGRRHLLSGKTTKRKRTLRRKGLVSSAQSKLMKRSLPYLG
ncbi:MAG: 50S ribosomal protein L35 [Candidatus Omnitrophota bacterium]|nr:MAG: 50S ribosomal protein L35 [Candidatus Omnitrophota bacterium]